MIIKSFEKGLKVQAKKIILKKFIISNVIFREELRNAINFIWHSKMKLGRDDKLMDLAELKYLIKMTTKNMLQLILYTNLTSKT